MRDFKLRFLNRDPHKSEIKEYDILLDGSPAGALAFYVSDNVAHIYNVYIDDHWRGNGIFREWIIETFEGVVAYDVLPHKEAYWASLGEYTLHKNAGNASFEDMVFTEEEIIGCLKH